MDLMSLLCLKRQAPDIFTGVSPPTTRGRIFGGLIVAQALVAAQETLVGRPVHSLHAYFIRPGDPQSQIDYRVETLRDGRSFSLRRVSAMQNGKIIFEMTASFHEHEVGLEHNFVMPRVVEPEYLENLKQIGKRLGAQLPPGLSAYFARKGPIELRPVSLDRYLPKSGKSHLEPRQDIWVRCTEPLSADPSLHQAALAYISDMTLLDCALVTHGRTVFDATIQAASLDHAIWFHLPVNANDWLLYTQTSPATGSGRGLTSGSLFTREGLLVASVIQEGLIRIAPPISNSITQTDS